MFLLGLPRKSATPSGLHRAVPTIWSGLSSQKSSLDGEGDHACCGNEPIVQGRSAQVCYIVPLGLISKRKDEVRGLHRRSEENLRIDDRLFCTQLNT